MAKRITIDPITRIEGHLRIDVEVDNNAVSNAWASCTMWRGIENILRGRDPRDAWLFTQRFCGVCTTVHAMASVRAVEDALKAGDPAQRAITSATSSSSRMRCTITSCTSINCRRSIGSTFCRSPRPIPQRTSQAGGEPLPLDAQFAQRIQSGAGSRQGRRRQRTARHFHERLLGTSGDAPLARCQPARLLALRAGARVSAQGIAGGRNSGLEDAAHPEPDRRRRCQRHRSRQPSALNMDRLEMIRGLLRRRHPVHARSLSRRCLRRRVDVSRVVQDRQRREELSRRSRSAARHRGLSLRSSRRLHHERRPRRRASLSRPLPIKISAQGVTEDVTHAYYHGDKPLHPWKGETEPDFTGWNGDQKYSWVKAPRFNGSPMQVGPLAQVLVGYAQGHPLTVKHTKLAIDKVAAIGGHSGHPRHAALDPRPPCRTRHPRRHAGGTRADSICSCSTDNIAKGDYSVFNQPVFPCARDRRRGHARSAARHAVALDRDQRREDQELSGGRAFHLERQPARSVRRARALRGLAAAHPARASRRAAGSPADRALLRSLHGLRLPYLRSVGPPDRQSEGAYEEKS